MALSHFFPNRAPDTRFGHLAILFLKYFYSTGSNAFFNTPTPMGYNLIGFTLQKSASRKRARVAALHFQFNTFSLEVKSSCEQQEVLENTNRGQARFRIL